MKYLHSTIVLLALMVSNIKAQYVTIHNAKMVGFFTANYSACMVNDQMDTTCPDILKETSLDVSFGYDIDDLTGVQYFKSLRSLNCSVNHLSALPRLPASLRSLFCYSNVFTELPGLPDSLELLDCNDNPLTNLPELPSALQTLSCYAAHLQSLPDLPGALTSLRCSHNDIDSLPDLPPFLESLQCDENNLSVLPQLPQSLKVLNCGKNKLVNLPGLPQHLEVLDCHSNILGYLPVLPGTLQGLYCPDNRILCMPVLPAAINRYDIENNLFTCLPNYFKAADSSTKAMFPLCRANDSIHNPNGCYDSVRLASVYEPDIKGIVVYPNPSSAVFNVLIPETISDQFSTIEIFNLHGVLVSAVKAGAGPVVVDLSNEAGGLYYLVLKGHTKSFHFILTKVD